MVIFAIIIIFSVAVITSSLPFRFESTHRIVKQVNCLSCHAEEFRDVQIGTHIKMMNLTQKKTLHDYVSLYGNVSQPYKTLVGVCYTCHVAYENFNRFGLTDPFVFNGPSGTVDAQYGNIIKWPWPIGNRTVEYFNSANIAISVELEVLSVEPVNSTIDSTIKIILSNYSGQQVGSVSCDCGQILSKGDIQVIDVSSMTNDYFRVMLLMTGSWNSATINLRLYGTDKGTESFIINVNNSVVYTIPTDISGVSYFKTNGAYKAARLDAIWEVWKIYSVNGNIASSEVIETNTTTNGWISANTCSAPDAMCHINQKVTHLGMSDGMNPEKSFYVHEMEAVTSKQCKVCHLRYRYGLEIPLNVSPLPPLGN